MRKRVISSEPELHKFLAKRSTIFPRPLRSETLKIMEEAGTKIRTPEFMAETGSLILVSSLTEIFRNIATVGILPVLTKRVKEILKR